MWWGGREDIEAKESVVHAAIEARRRRGSAAALGAESRHVPGLVTAASALSPGPRVVERRQRLTMKRRRRLHPRGGRYCCASRDGACCCCCSTKKRTTHACSRGHRWSGGDATRKMTTTAAPLRRLRCLRSCQLVQRKRCRRLQQGQHQPLQRFRNQPTEACETTAARDRRRHRRDGGGCARAGCCRRHHRGGAPCGSRHRHGDGCGRYRRAWSCCCGGGCCCHLRWHLHHRACCGASGGCQCCGRGADDCYGCCGADHHRCWHHRRRGGACGGCCSCRRDDRCDGCGCCSHGCCSCCWRRACATARDERMKRRTPLRHWQHRRHRWLLGWHPQPPADALR